tara:strand:+ start:706 stop:1044 length:339 start_codon:yes stop_codon:yes gene_type:complete
MLKKSIFFCLLLASLTIQIFLPVATAATSGASQTKQITNEKTITLLVPGMTCSVCPITVSNALKNILGVSTVSVNFEEKTAIVTFNPQEVSASALIKATTDVGYPSSISSEN